MTRLSWTFGLIFMVGACLAPIAAHARPIIEDPFDPAFPGDPALAGSQALRLDETLPPTPDASSFTVAAGGVQFSFVNAPVGCNLFPTDSQRCYLRSRPFPPMVIIMNPPVSVFGITGFTFGEGAHRPPVAPYRELPYVSSARRTSAASPPSSSARTRTGPRSASSLAGRPPPRMPTSP